MELRLPHHHEGDSWRQCVMCRSTVQGQSVLQRARQRSVVWPSPKPYNTQPLEDPPEYTNLDDAFASMLRYMNTASRNCKRYYKSSPQSSVSNPQDTQHCNRFHTARYTRAQRTNPLASTEDVHLRVTPGTYAVTAGEWGTGQQQTHVVNVTPGQTVSVDFVV